MDPSNTLATPRDCSPKSTELPMDAHPKIPWPATYLARLQAVTMELGRIGAPASVADLAERFSGVTADQIEATLAALVLFGKIDKKEDQYFADPHR